MKYRNVPDKIIYTPSYVDLNNDKRQEIIIYMWEDCGTGGCSLLIARRSGSGYRIISELDPIRLPVRVSNRRHHGWRNIITLEGGTANDAPFNVEYRFDGKSYTDKLSRAATGKPRGRILLSEKSTIHNRITLQNPTTGQKIGLNCGRG
jgi:hypothetical protein